MPLAPHHHVPDPEMGPTSEEQTPQQPSDSDFYQTSKQKRQKQTSNSDRIENNRGSEYGPKFRKDTKKRY